MYQTQCNPNGFWGILALNPYGNAELVRNNIDRAGFDRARFDSTNGDEGDV